MKKMLSLSLLLMLCFIATTVYTQEENPGTALNPLVEAERAFAKTSETQGMREAFMGNLAAESIVFLPRPVDGRTAYAESSTVPGELLWQPVFADVALAGDLGYTTSPWEYRKRGLADTPAAFGHYVSIWGKDADNAWKVLVDIGINHPEPGTLATALSFPGQKAAESTKALDAAAEQAALIEMDQVFLNTSKAEGFVKAFQLYAADSV